MFARRAAYGLHQRLITAAKFINAESSIRIADTSKQCSSLAESSSQKNDESTKISAKEKWTPRRPAVRVARPAYNARDLIAEYLNISVNDCKIRLIDENCKDLGVMMKSSAEAMAMDRDLTLTKVKDDEKKSPSDGSDDNEIVRYALLRTGRNSGWRVRGDHGDEYAVNKRAHVERERVDKAERQTKVKHFWLKATSNEHDVQFKLRQIRDYLEKGTSCRVLVSVKDKKQWQLLVDCHKTVEQGIGDIAKVVCAIEEFTDRTHIPLDISPKKR